MVIGNSEGVGVSKAKVFKGRYEANLEFSEGWEGSNQFFATIHYNIPETTLL